MAKLEAVKPTRQDAETVTSRWKRILQLPERTPLWDMSTGQRYFAGDFRPLFSDQYHSKCETFAVVRQASAVLKDELETVYVPFLRLMPDKAKCSLVGGGHA